MINLATGTVNPTPFLDISSKSGQGQGTGILGMTFDPNYATNGHFYVACTTDRDGVFNSGVSLLARFTVSANPDVADAASEVTVLTADQTQPGHNFDWIGFSPRPADEGNLYICSGDGGGSDDFNISTRGLVETGDNVLIGGLIIQGATDSQVLIRAIGPTLAGAGVDGALADSVLELHDKEGALIDTNENWKGTQQSEIDATGLAPTDDKESAILATLSMTSTRKICLTNSKTNIYP